VDIKKLFENMEIYDISVGLSSKTPVFPGQPKFNREYMSKILEGGKANLSKFSMTSHTGTHVDSPFHFIKEGNTIDEVSFSSIVGFAKVIKINAPKIDLDEIKNIEIDKDDIVLFKTSNSKLWEIEDFSYDYVYITPKAAEYLANKGVHAVGVDYIIPEAFNDKERPVHHILLGQNIILIEGLNLSNVPEGDYGLVCLPLKILGNDAAPARAILFRFLI
jgi:arylformamidase